MQDEEDKPRNIQKVAVRKYLRTTAKAYDVDIQRHVLNLQDQLTRISNNSKQMVKNAKPGAKLDKDSAIWYERASHLLSACYEPEAQNRITKPGQVLKAPGSRPILQALDYTKKALKKGAAPKPFGIRNAERAKAILYKIFVEEGDIQLDEYHHLCAARERGFEPALTEAVAEALSEFETANNMKGGA